MNEGLDLKEAGMKLALDREDIQPWKQQFYAAVVALPLGKEFTSEDILEVVGLPSGEPGLNINNAVGGAMNALARWELIIKTGVHVRSRRRASHATEINLWRRV